METRPYPLHLVYIGACIWESSAWVAHLTRNVVRIIFHEPKCILCCAYGALVTNTTLQGCTTSILSDLTACCWDSSDTWRGRLSPKLGLLLFFLYLGKVTLIAAIPALPVSSPAPTLAMCSVPHMACIISPVSKQPQDLGQGWEPPVAWHLCKYTKPAVLEGCCSLHHSCAWLLPGNLWPDLVCTRCSQINAFAERSATPLLETAHSCSYFSLLKECSSFVFVFISKRQQRNQPNKTLLFNVKTIFCSHCKKNLEEGRSSLKWKDCSLFSREGDQIVQVPQQQIALC